ncbi:MAG: transcriptional regulator [Alphaproteobacteria bacterium]|nr:MAG: transcriptional regulator [Alphaproteobacteria bacterium]
MLVKIFVRTFSSNEDCELFESMLETKWPSLLQTVKGVRFRSLKNPNTPNVSVVIWEFPDKEIMRNIEKLIQENIQKYVKTLTPKTIEFTGVVTQDLGDLSFN